MNEAPQHAPERANAFGFLRLFLAASVIYSHGYALGGFGQEPLGLLTDKQMSLGSLAVHAFFVISGYLVTDSYLRSGSTVRYLWKRFLRIAPALWVCLIVTAFILTPFVWSLHPAPPQQLGDLLPAQFHYVFDNLFRPRTTINIESYPYGGHVFHGGDWNGSLWTLFYEAACYVMVAGLGLLTVLRRPRFAFVLLAGFLLLHIAWCLLPDVFPPVVGRLFDTPGKRETLHFFSGAAWCVAPASIARGLSRPWIAWACAPLLVLSWFGTHHLWLSPVALTPIIFALAHHLPFKNWEQRLGGDYSYGLYIYGMPAQQCLAALGLHHIGLFPYLSGGLLAALAFAWLSWHFVEKPSLRIKTLSWPFISSPSKLSSS